MRDILVHDYRGTSLKNVWYAATASVPALIAALEPLIPQNPDDESSSDYAYIGRAAHRGADTSATNPIDRGNAMSARSERAS
jgi:hypothetical protein